MFLYFCHEVLRRLVVSISHQRPLLLIISHLASIVGYTKKKTNVFAFYIASNFFFLLGWDRWTPPSQEPRPTCWWKWVGRTKGVKSGISTLTANISAKFQCFHQSRAFFGTAHAWIFRIRWETEKRFTNIVTGAPRVSSPSFARFFPQFRQDLFGFVTYGFLTVHLSDLFHLSIRSGLQLRNVVLMCISSFI